MHVCESYIQICLDLRHHIALEISDNNQTMCIVCFTKNSFNSEYNSNCLTL